MVGLFDELINYNNQSETPKKPSDKMMDSLTSMGFYSDELNTFLRHKGNALVISCAGSGKTTSLTLKIIMDTLTGDSTEKKFVNETEVRVLKPIFVSTFLKSGAEDLKRSLDDWSTKLQVPSYSKNIRISTLHSEFYSALKAMGRIPYSVDERRSYAILTKVLRSFKLGYNGVLSKEDIYRVSAALTKTRNELNNLSYFGEVYDEYRITPDMVEHILDETKRLRFHEGICDFEDIQEILYQLLADGDNEARNFVASRYKVIYLDEFQDVSQIQYFILRHYFSGADRVTAVGDDDQVIYTWRGSDKKIITDHFLKDVDATLLHLSTNYRCPSNILNSVIPSINKNVERFPKDMKSSSEGGEVRLSNTSNSIEMGKVLEECVLADIRDGRTVAILVRTNSDGLIPAIIMNGLKRVKYSISSEGMTFSSGPGRTALAVPRLFTSGDSTDIRRLMSFLSRNKLEVSTLMDHVRENRKTFWDLSAQDISYSCPTMGSRLNMWKSYRSNHTDIETLRFMLDDLNDNVFTYGSNFSESVKAALQAMMQLLDRNGYSNLSEFMIDLEDLNLTLEYHIKSRADISIETVHEAKGKEADSVYVWNDSDRVFPHHPYKGKVDMEEERRIHYIACTRAKKTLTLLYKGHKASPFIKEMNLDNAVYLNNFKGTL